MCVDWKHYTAQNDLTGLPCKKAIITFVDFGEDEYNSWIEKNYDFFLSFFTQYLASVYFQHVVEYY